MKNREKDYFKIVIFLKKSFSLDFKHWLVKKLLINKKDVQENIDILVILSILINLIININEVGNQENFFQKFWKYQKIYLKKSRFITINAWTFFTNSQCKATNFNQKFLEKHKLEINELHLKLDKYKDFLQLTIKLFQQTQNCNQQLNLENTYQLIDVLQGWINELKTKFPLNFNLVHFVTFSLISYKSKF